MKMKTLYLLVIVISSLKCQEKKEISLRSKMIGVWELCSKENDDRITKYNICPQIQFEDNLKGKVLKSNEVFFWDVLDSTLLINRNNQANGDRLFEDSGYRISISPKNEYSELRLKGIISGIVLVLGK